MVEQWPLWIAGAVCAGVVVYAVRRIRDTRRKALRGLQQMQETVRRLQSEQAAALARFRYAEWWARNAAETNSDDVLRFTLIECALLALACPTIEEVGSRIATRVATEPNARRSSMLRSVLSELTMKKPTKLDGVTLETTDEPWPPWDKHDVERPGKPRHNVRALGWFVLELERGAYCELVRAFEAACAALALPVAAPGTPTPSWGAHGLPDGVTEADGAILSRFVGRRIAGNSRALPAHE